MVSAAWALRPAALPVWAPLSVFCRCTPPFSERGGQGGQPTTLPPPESQWEQPAAEAHRPSSAHARMQSQRHAETWDDLGGGVLRSGDGGTQDKWARSLTVQNLSLDIQT